MVMLIDELVARDAARKVVRGLGVPDQVLDAADAMHPDLDWRTLMFALDGVFLAHGGGLAQAAFLQERQPDLQGQTPLEALVKADGPRRVSRAAVACAARQRVTA